jgi:methyltransferase
VTSAGFGLAQWLIVAVAVQRLAELLLARRNTENLLAAGGRETGAGHYKLIVALHGGWLVAIFLTVAPDATVNWWLIGAFAVLQAGRIWVIASLGRYWTTRIVTLPGAPLIHGGPYRWMRHPNYLIVAGEIALLPLAFGAWEIALGFSIANLAVTAWRIKIEDQALESRRAA